MHRRRSLPLILCALLALTACGGTAVPPTAILRERPASPVAMGTPGATPSFAASAPSASAAPPSAATPTRGASPTVAAAASPVAQRTATPTARAATPSRPAPTATPTPTPTPLTATVPILRPLRAIKRGTTTGTASALSPDGAIVAGGSDGGVGLWSARDGRLLRTIEDGAGFSGYYYSLAFSTDGATLAGSNGYEITLWNVADGRLLHTLEGYKGDVDSLAFSPDGTLLAGGDDDGLLLVWDLASASVRHRFTNFKEKVAAVAFSPDGKTLAAGSWDDTVVFYNVADGTTIRTVRAGSGVKSLAFDPTGARIAVGLTVSGALIADVASGKLAVDLLDQGDTIGGIAYTPDGRFVIGGAGDKSITVWDAASGKRVALLRGHTDDVANVAIGRDGRTLVSGSWDDTALVWDLAPALAAPVPVSPPQPPALPGPARATPLTADQFGTGIKLSPDGRFATSIVGTNVILTATADGEKRTLAAHTLKITALGFSADGKVLASAANDGQIAIWDTASGALRRTIKTDLVAAFVALNADGTLLATNGKKEGAYRPTVQLWETASGQPAALLRAPDEVLNFDAAAFSPDGRYLAVSDLANPVLLFDLASGKPLWTGYAHHNRPDSLVFSPDGKTLVTAGWDGLIVLWDVATGADRATLFAHTAKIEALALSPDGRQLVSAGLYETLVWDFAGGALRGRIAGASRALAAAYSPDGSTIAVATGKELTFWAAR